MGGFIYFPFETGLKTLTEIFLFALIWELFFSSHVSRMFTRLSNQNRIFHRLLDNHMLKKTFWSFLSRRVNRTWVRILPNKTKITERSIAWWMLWSSDIRLFRWVIFIPCFILGSISCRLRASDVRIPGLCMHYLIIEDKYTLILIACAIIHHGQFFFWGISVVKFEEKDFLNFIGKNLVPSRFDDPFFVISCWFLKNQDWNHQHR